MKENNPEVVYVVQTPFGFHSSHVERPGDEVLGAAGPNAEVIEIEVHV
jgi:hypothetical protein